MEKYTDKYENNFKSLNEAIEEFETFKDNATVQVVENNSLSVAVFDENNSDNAEFSNIRDEVREDTVNNSRLVLCTANDVIPIRECAVSHVLDRSGYACEVAKKKRSLFPSEFAADVTRNFTVMGGRSTLYTSFEKISCLGSEQFAALEMADLANILVDSLESRTGANARFLNGGISHEYASLRLIVDAPDLVASYNREVMLHECDAERNTIRPVITLSTSNTKNSGAALIGTLVDEKSKVRIPIGQLSTVVHKGNPEKRLELFAKNCDTLYSKYRNVTERLTALMNIELEYPLSAFMKIGKKIGMHRPYIVNYFVQAYNNYLSMWGPSPTNAHELYWGISETLRFMEEANAPLSHILIAEELLMECLSSKFPWESFDIKEKAAITNLSA